MALGTPATSLSPFLSPFVRRAGTGEYSRASISRKPAMSHATKPATASRKPGGSCCTSKREPYERATNTGGYSGRKSPHIRMLAPAEPVSKRPLTGGKSARQLTNALFLAN